MTLSMWDTINPSDLVGHIPASGDAVAGYNGGNSWPDYWTLVRLFPLAKHLDIVLRPSFKARCFDIESGGGTASEAGWWLDNMADKTRGKPVLYTFASNVDAVRASAGRRDYLIWSAHFNYHPHICAPGVCGFPQADATQWTDHALPGRDADQSLCADHFFTATPTPPPPDDHHFEHFASAKWKGGLQGGPWDLGFPAPLDERDVVLHYYGAHPHPDKYKDYLPVLRAELTALAHRVAHVAMILEPLKNGNPSWGVDRRGERYRRLLHMGQGGKPQ